MWKAFLLYYSEIIIQEEVWGILPFCAYGFFVLVVVLNCKSVPFQIPHKVMFSLTVLLNNLNGHLPAKANVPDVIWCGGWWASAGQTVFLFFNHNDILMVLIFMGLSGLLYGFAHILFGSLWVTKASLTSYFTSRPLCCRQAAEEVSPYPLVSFPFQPIEDATWLLTHSLDEASSPIVAPLWWRLSPATWALCSQKANAEEDLLSHGPVTSFC